MSISVPAADVPERLSEYGRAPFLLTTSLDGRVKVVHVAGLWDIEAAAFHCSPGGGTLQNLAGAEIGPTGGPATLVFSGPDADTHSWLVDATGTADPEHDGWVVLAYESGVLHRPAPEVPGDQRNC